MANPVARPSNSLKIRIKRVSTAYIAKKTFADEYSGEVLEYTFKSDGNKTHNKERKEHISKIILDNETKKGNLNTTDKRTNISEITKVLTKDEYNKGDCISISLIKNKVTFTRVNQASLGDDICIIVKTEHLQGDEIKMNLKQLEDKVLVDSGTAITVQQNNAKAVLIKAIVGDYSNDTSITNADDFKDWAIADVKLEPKDTELRKSYIDALNATDNKSTKLYLVIDA